MTEGKSTNTKCGGFPMKEKTLKKKEKSFLNSMGGERRCLAGKNL